MQDVNKHLQAKGGSGIRNISVRWDEWVGNWGRGIGGRLGNNGTVRVRGVNVTPSKNLEWNTWDQYFSDASYRTRTRTQSALADGARTRSRFDKRRLVRGQG